MRAPRYQFSEETRAMTRDIASRMLDQGTAAQTPEQLETWIASAPDARAVLERDGYGTNFTAHDLFPLLQGAITRLGGPAPPVVEEKPAGSSRTWMLVVFLVVLFAVLVYALVTNASAQTP